MRGKKATPSPCTEAAPLIDTDDYIRLMCGPGREQVRGIPVERAGRRRKNGVRAAKIWPPRFVGGVSEALVSRRLAPPTEGASWN